MSLESSHVDATLDSFAELITDGDHNPPSRHPDGIPHLVVKHVSGGHLDLRDCTYISRDDFERVRRRYDPRGGDLVVTCVGSIGRVAIVPRGLVFSADRSLALFRPRESELLPEFAKALLESESLQRQMTAKAIGTAQKHLYLTDIRQLRVAVPGLVTQRRILSRLGVLTGALSNAKRTESTLDLLLGQMTNSITARHV